MSFNSNEIKILLKNINDPNAKELSFSLNLSKNDEKNDDLGNDPNKILTFSCDGFIKQGDFDSYECKILIGK